MPRERAQPLGVEIPLALRQLRDVTPPGVSPLVEDADVARRLHFYFLTARIPLAAAQVQHLGSPERLAFGSAPLPRVAKKRPRHSLPFSLADLITRLRQPPCLILALWLPLPCLTRLTARGEDPRTSHVQTARDWDPSTLLFLLVLVVFWSVFWFPLNSQGRDPSTRRGRGPRRHFT